MSALIAGSALRTCLGDGAATFAALLEGRDGAGPLRHGDSGRLRVAVGYHCEPVPEGYAPSRWLAECALEALAATGVDPGRSRVACVVGTGLGELAQIERVGAGPVASGPNLRALEGLSAHRMHFGDAIRAAIPGVRDVVTISNACSAGGHALALAQDMIELGEADAVIAAAADGMTESMLAMIGRVSDRPTERVRPFDAARTGALLGEGAAAVVVVPDTDRPRPPLARLLATGLSCDAHHETAPSPQGIGRAMRDALERAGRPTRDIGLVLAHGTGTALNDPAECAALREVLLAGGADPLVTGIKGAVGHMSGAAALASLDVALRCLASCLVPPIAGLDTPLPEADGLTLVRGEPAALPPGAVVQIDAFGFGGVNAVTLLEAA